MTTTIKTNELVVLGVNFDGATVAVNGETHTIGWAMLRAAATQDDAGLRDAYARLLSQAKTAAAAKKVLAVKVNNRTNTPHGYTAELYDVAGEFVSGRIVAADFGLDGNAGYAARDAQSAATKLRAMGYEIVVR